MRTPELAASLGCSTMTLNRLAKRGVLQPCGGGSSGFPFSWPATEQHAASAVVAFQRSHLFADKGLSPTGAEARDDALRAIAAAARAPIPSGCRWLMLLPDGRCVPVTDGVAAGWGGPRTLIEIG